MKLKYYLRGLGIGIIITTLVLMIAFSGHKEELSDEEIVKRAQALGMVMMEDASSEDINEIPDATEEKKVQSTETENTEVQNTETQTVQEQNTEMQSTESSDEQEKNTEIADAETTSAESGAETETESSVTADIQPVENEEISFTINAGQTSDTIAFNLYQAGIVDDATAFNSYMVKNGYDSRLRTGTFRIKKNASYGEVVSVLTR